MCFSTIIHWYTVSTNNTMFFKVVYGNVGILTALQEIYVSQFKEGHNLFLLELLSIIPFLFLSAYMLSYTSKATIKASYAVCMGGIVGALVLIVPGHFSIWHSIYTNSPGSSTAVIGFLFLPFISIIPMCIGGYVGYLFSKKTS